MINSDSSAFLLPNESVAWELDTHEGVLHRHLKSSYYVTNMRVLAVDRVENRVVVSIPIRETDAVVMDRHTASNSFGGGTYHGGVYTSTRAGSSRSVGTIVFMTNGVERIKLMGIGDPEGVKNLFNAIKKEVTQSGRE